MSQIGTQYLKANGGAVLAADPAPNATPPADADVFRLTSSRPNPVTDGWYVAAKGGSPTVTVWVKAKGLDRWMALDGATALVVTADVVKTFALGSIPFNRDLFVQVTAPNGCTGIELGVTQQ